MLIVELFQISDVSRPNDEGITALHNAICACHYEIVKFLVEAKADVNALVRFTPLKSPVIQKQISRIVELSKT